MARSHISHPGVRMADVAMAGERALQRRGDSAGGAQIEWGEEKCYLCRLTTRISRISGDISPPSTIPCCTAYLTAVR